MKGGTLKIAKKLLHSYLSFRPLVEALKKNIEEGNTGMKNLYSDVLQFFEEHPELIEPITDLSVLDPHSEMIEELLSAVFPATTANYMYGVSIPFRLESVYVSPLFKNLLLYPGTNKIIVPGAKSSDILDKEAIHFACGLILKKYLDYPNPDNTKSIYPYIDKETKLKRFMELRLDGRFIDVKPAGEMPELPESILDKQTNRLYSIEELVKMVPIDQFVFEGITPIRVNDVTEMAIITEIKNKLLDHNAFSNSEEYNELESYIQSLIGLRNLSIGITPIFKINEHYVYSDLHNNNSIIFKELTTIAEKDEISDYCKILFRESNQPVLYESITDKMLLDVQCLKHYYAAGGRSLIICPLKKNNELIGLLEVMSTEPFYIKPSHINKIEAAIPLFTLGMEKTLEQLNNQVDAVIKMKFTAVQPAVEWKFTEVALNYIVEKSKQTNAGIGRIAFNDVHPLYGSMDIRNSSTERAHAIQLDLIEQLENARTVVLKAQEKTTFPLLKELEFKIDKHINAALDVLQAEEELSIQEFLQGELIAVFNHMLETEPLIKEEAEKYFSAIDPAVGMLYHHRKNYEDSIFSINDTLAHFIDKEQAAAQKVYPHFFERYITDGLEFNIHIGQSITPRKKFDDIYLRNMKMWQLSVIAKAAMLTHKLEKELAHPLRTTQLILSHSQPLSISFRTDERKFDVDGAYNTRYEIVKKRIDKVRIKDTNERLTQPGKIAIVYSQAKDAAEYSEYIEYLQNKKLLKQGIEKHDLEELQGVIGLKALRVDINFEMDEMAANSEKELSALTSGQLLDK